MNYASISDMSNVIRQYLNKIPNTVDLVVGVPRSGMLAAPMIALNLNIKFCDIQSFIENKELHHGSRPTNSFIMTPQEANHILVIDDSVSAGTSIQKVKTQLEQYILPHQTVSYAAIYASKQGAPYVDIFIEQLEHPRFFEWNLFHRSEASEFCFDIDGVLCRDPLEYENDDGEQYINFIKTVPALVRPSVELGYIVTSRLEKYRSETESWLLENNIKFKKLYMLNAKNAEERRKMNLHGTHKASIYSSIKNSTLFIESETSQAIDIANLSGKHTLDFINQKLIKPGLSLVDPEQPITH